MVGASLLIIERDKELAESISAYFSAFGYQVDVSFSGEEAIGKLKANSEYDLIICAVDLGDIKAIEIKRFLKEANVDIPLIYLSGFANLKLLNELLEEGVNAFFLKPFKLDLLLKKAGQLIEQEKIKKEILNLKLLFSLNNFAEEISQLNQLDDAFKSLKKYLDNFVKADGCLICERSEDDFYYFYCDSKYIDKDTNFCDCIYKKANGMTDGSELHGFFAVSGKDVGFEFAEEVLMYKTLQKTGRCLNVVVYREKEPFILVEKAAFTVLMNHFENYYHMQRYREELEKAYIETVESLVKTIEARDPYAGDHTESVQKIAVEIGKKLELSKAELKILKLAARLHDIGKIGIPDSILLKPGKLTDEEYELIKRHPQIGFEILSKVDNLKELAKVVLHHHEWYSGKGYPFGLKGEEIPLLSRILCISDAFHALISDRPYRKAFSMEKALQIIKEETPEKFDPKLSLILEELVKEGKI